MSHVFRQLSASFNIIELLVIDRHLLMVRRALSGQAGTTSSRRLKCSVQSVKPSALITMSLGGPDGRF